MKLILHPGHGKCGSSSIQQWISSNISVLRKKGILIPGGSLEVVRAPEDYRVSSFFLKHLLTKSDKSGFERALDNFINEAGKSGDTVLWSDEFLTDPRVINGTFSMHEIVKERFPDIRVIYFIRRQDDFILSGWQQWRHKGGLTLEEECTDCMRKPDPDYLKNIELLESVYGRESLHVHPFDRRFFLNGDLVQEFQKLIQVNDSDLINDPVQTNVSLNPYLCDILHFVSEGLYKNDLDDNKVKDWLEYNIESPVLHESNKGFMSSDLRSRIMDHFRSHNRHIHETYFSELNFEEIFGKKNIDESTNPIDGLKTVIALQYELMYKMNARIIKQEKDIQRLKTQMAKSLTGRLRKLLKGK